MTSARGTYDHELVPTASEIQDRDYPEYALSTPRLRVRGAKLVAWAGSRAFENLALPEYSDTVATMRRLLARLKGEGLEYIYWQTVEAQDFNPLRLKQKVEKHSQLIKAPHLDIP